MVFGRSVEQLNMQSSVGINHLAIILTGNNVSLLVLLASRHTEKAFSCVNLRLYRVRLIADQPICTAASNALAAAVAVISPSLTARSMAGSCSATAGWL